MNIPLARRTSGVSEGQKMPKGGAEHDTSGAGILPAEALPGVPEQGRPTAGAQVQVGVQKRKQTHRGYGIMVKEGVWSLWQTPSTARLLQHD